MKRFKLSIIIPIISAMIIIPGCTGNTGNPDVFAINTAPDPIVTADSDNQGDSDKDNNASSNTDNNSDSTSNTGKDIDSTSSSGDDSSGSSTENSDTQNSTVDISEKLEGEWERTNSHSSAGGSIGISNVDETGFDFTGEFYYFARMGSVEGRALFTSENEAVYEQPDSEENSCIHFILDGDCLKVDSEGFISGMGFNVIVDGEYTKGTPVYINANIVKDTYSDEELEKIKLLLGDEDYESKFLNDTECGAVMCNEMTLTDGSKAKVVECSIPGMFGYMGYTMAITEKGEIYYIHEDGTVKSTDKNCTGESYILNLLGRNNG